MPFSSVLRELATATTEQPAELAGKRAALLLDESISGCRYFVELDGDRDPFVYPIERRMGGEVVGEPSFC